MTSISENGPQDNPLHALQSRDPDLLAEVLSDGLNWIVAAKDDAKRLRAHGFPVVCIAEPDTLSRKLVKSFTRLIVLQRPGPEGAQFGWNIKKRLQALKWRGVFTRAFLPDPFFDLAIVERETGPDRFGPFIASCAAGGQTETIEKAKPQPWEHEDQDAGKVIPLHPIAPRSLADVVRVFQQWLHLPELGPLYALLGTIAANRLQGDPVWLMLVGAPGSGKTELVQALSLLPDVHMAGTLTEPALLSGTATREKVKGASGGLLRELDAFGFILCKDFGSVLSMHREARAAVLAALREIYDGAWTRHVGVDGGRTLAWKGKVALIAACTPAIDSQHVVMSTMGERFIFYRLHSTADDRHTLRAIELAGKEATVRKALSEAVAGLFASFTPPEHPYALEPEAKTRLVALAQLAARCRSAVQRDYQGEVELIPDAEVPGRLALTLLRLLAGLRAIGVEEAESWRVLYTIADDCMPALRRAIFHQLREAESFLKTSEIAQLVAHPTKTTKRALEDLTAHGMVIRQPGGQGMADRWGLSDWADTLYQQSRGTKPETSGGEVRRISEADLPF